MKMRSMCLTATNVHVASDRCETCRGCFALLNGTSGIESVPQSGPKQTTAINTQTHVDQIEFYQEARNPQSLEAFKETIVRISKCFIPNNKVCMWLFFFF